MIKLEVMSNALSTLWLPQAIACRGKMVLSPLFSRLSPFTALWCSINERPGPPVVFSCQNSGAGILRTGAKIQNTEAQAHENC